MKNILIAVSLMLTTFSFVACTDTTAERKASSNTTAEANVAAEATKNTPATPTTQVVPEAVYACPMHADQKGKKGEKCAKCGMELTVLVKKDSIK